MKGGTLAVILADVVTLLASRGVITPAGDFDETKLDDVGEILALASGVEAILQKHGVQVPAKVDAILRILPLAATLGGAFKH